MRRIELLQKRLRNWLIDGILIENPIDLLYLTHMKMSRGRLWVGTKDVELQVDGRYFDEAKLCVHCPVSLWKKSDGGKVGCIGFDCSSTSVANLDKLKKEFSSVEWVPLEQPLMEQRIIKDHKEIECMQRAAQITWQGIEHIQSLWKAGVSEQDLAFTFEFFVRKMGASALSFDPIVAFGENSAYPHHRSTNRILKNDEIILIDVGVVYQNYCSDVTRVFNFGKPDDELERMKKLVHQAYLAAQVEAVIGASIGQIDLAARSVFRQAGIEELFTHSLGHGIGLEPHEKPLIRMDGGDQDTRLAEGMVIAIEPGLYRPGKGGIRYENSGQITQQGFVSFYPDYTQR